MEETLCGLWLPPGSRRGFLVYDRARVVAILARERADEAKVAALAKRAQADRRARERARLAAIPTGFVTLTELRQRIYGFAELSNRVLHRRLERELGKRNLRFGAGTPPRRLYRLDAVVARFVVPDGFVSYSDLWEELGSTALTSAKARTALGEVISVERVVDRKRVRFYCHEEVLERIL